MPYETTMTAQGQVQALRERRAMKDGITHCPRCGHHVNIQFGETIGYCPICDEEVLDIHKCDFCKNNSSCSGVSRSECIVRDFYHFKAERSVADEVATIAGLIAELRAPFDPVAIAKYLVQNGVGLKD